MGQNLYNDKELVKILAERVTKTEGEAKLLLDRFLRYINNGILDGKVIKISCFGKFYMKVSPAMIGPERQIPSIRKIFFQKSSHFFENIDNHGKS